MAWGKDPPSNICPRCKKKELIDSQTICAECAAEESGEAAAGEADNSTRREARRQDGAEPKGVAVDPAPPAKDPPAQGRSQGQPQQGGEQQQGQPGQRRVYGSRRQGQPQQGGEQQQGQPGPAIGGSTGRKDKRPRMVVYGPGSVGKTSLMCEAPKIAVIPCEVGADGFDVFRYDELDYGGTAKGPPRTFGEVRSVLKKLLTDKHDFDWVGIDGAGVLEAMIFAEVVKDYNASPFKKGNAGTLNEVAGGYKTGQENAVEKWRFVLGDLDRLREQRGMGIIVTGHAVIRKFDDPVGVAFDRYHLKLDERGAGVLFEWADLVLFANFIAKTKKVGRKLKGIGGRERALYTERTDAYDAKQRAPYVLPPQLAMPEGDSFGNLWRQIEMRKHPDLIIQEIERILDQLDGVKVAVKGRGELPIVDLAVAELEKNPAPERLLHLKNRLEARLDQLEDEREAAAETSQPADGAA